MPEQSNNKNTIWIILGVVILIAAVIAAVFFVNMDNDNDGDENNSSSSSVESSSSSSESIADSTSPTLLGSFTGSGSVLSPIMQFPEANMNIQPTGFTFTGNGLDLAALGNEALQVSAGVYPVASATITGTISDGPTATDKILNVESIDITFTAGGQTLDAATTATIIQGLATAGLVIPEASSTAPVPVPITITPDASGNITITQAPTSPLVVNFTGSPEIN